MLNVFMILLCCPILWKSSKYLVKGAVSVSEKLNIQKSIIGATALAMGTSATEIAVNYSALGSVFFLNIFNLGIILTLVIGHHKINRWQGLMIIITYISYIEYMIVQS